MGRPRRSVGAGSPPHRRGKVSVMLSIPAHIGITPAWAGKSHTADHVACIPEDHPRVGGEKLACAAAVAERQGSPPRGRGKGNFSPPFDNPKRITPAWAGKSLRAGSTARPKGGSPPRGRGKAAGSSSGEFASGITPAWAGKRRHDVRLRCVNGDHPRVGGEKVALYCPCEEMPGSPPRGRGKGCFRTLTRL